MTDILKLQVNDESLSNIINNNPFYIDIKGSVNICLIRCGQDIENCNSVNFSSMTNYGKILVINPNDNKSQCKIKLAFDTSNENNDNGMGNYNFIKAFVTVPSLHRLNGEIYDMETFLVFSSVQKNGNILYVVLCTLNSGTIDPPDDWKLLNYKLLDELFSKNNTVPDIHGTTAISGIPNPVDLNNFIPPEGLRSFYDYTNPNNSIVNIRVYQNPMAVSNDVLGILKKKLTPESIYTDFKSYISKSINPTENLFFYYSKDLTNDYKSYEANNTKEKSKIKDKSVIKENEKKDDILEEYEKENADETLKKLDINENDNDFKTEEEDNTKNMEKFEDNNNTMHNYGVTLIIIIVCFIFFYIIIYTKSFILNLFVPRSGLSPDKLKNSIYEINNDIIRSILTARLGLNSNLVLQGIVTFFIVLLSIFYIINAFDRNSIYNGIIAFLVFLLILIINFFRLVFRYYSGKLRMLYDDDYNQKENYFYDLIFNKIFKGNDTYDIIFKYGLFSAFSFKNLSFDKFILTNTTNTNNIQFGGNPIKEVVPGDNDNNKGKNNKNKEYQKKSETNYNESGFSGINIFKFISDNGEYILEKFNDNKEWISNYRFSILFHLMATIMLIYLFNLLFNNIGDNFSGIIGLLIFIGSSSFMIPLASISLGITTIFLYKDNNEAFKWITAILGVFLLLWIISSYVYGLYINNNEVSTPMGNLFIACFVIYYVIIVGTYFYYGVSKIGGGGDNLSKGLTLINAIPNPLNYNKNTTANPEVYAAPSPISSTDTVPSVIPPEPEIPGSSGPSEPSRLPEPSNPLVPPSTLSIPSSTDSNQIQMLSDQIAELKNLIMNRNPKNSSSEINRILDEIKIIREEIQRLEQFIQNNKINPSNISDLRSSITKYSKIMEALKNKLNSTQDTPELNGMIANLIDEITTLEDRSSLLKQQISNPRSDTPQFNNTMIAPLLGEISNLEDTSTLLRQQLSNAKSDTSLSNRNLESIDKENLVKYLLQFVSEKNLLNEQSQISLHDLKSRLLSHLTNENRTAKELKTLQAELSKKDILTDKLLKYILGEISNSNTRSNIMKSSNLNKSKHLKRIRNRLVTLRNKIPEQYNEFIDTK